MTTALLLLLLDTGRPGKGTGNTYVTDGYAGTVTAFDRRGSVVWTVKSLAHPLGVWPRRGGGCYVGIERAVLELGRDGRILRKIEFKINGLTYVTTVQPLPRDRFLIVDFNPGSVAIIDASGAVEWRPAEGQYYDARCSANGSVFGVGPRGTVDELNSAGKVVKSIPAGGKSTWLELLPQGRFLVVLDDLGEVVEIDSEGKRIRTIEGLREPYSAQRLRDGRTLIGERGSERILEVDEEGRSVREWRAGRLRGAVRDE